MTDTTNTATAYDAWFLSQLDVAYDGMYDFGRAAYMRAIDADRAARGAAQAARAGWNACLRNLFSLTDQTGDEAAARETTEFMRGRAFEAKSVARAMNSFGPEHCDDLRVYFAAQAAAAQAAPVDADDSARWHFLAAYLVGPRTDLDDEIVDSDSVNELRKVVDAARAAQKGGK